MMQRWLKRRMLHLNAYISATDTKQNTNIVTLNVLALTDGLLNWNGQFPDSNAKMLSEKRAPSGIMAN